MCAPRRPRPRRWPVGLNWRSRPAPSRACWLRAAIFLANSPLLVNMMTLPLAIGAACIITSIIGTFFVKLGANQSIMGALYKGLIATGILSLIGVAGVIYWLVGFGTLSGVKFTGMALFECGIVGLEIGRASCRGRV